MTYGLRLQEEDKPRLQHMLQQDTVTNLFLLQCLHSLSIRKGTWYGAQDDEHGLKGAAIVFPKRLTVPFATDPTAAEALAAHIAVREQPTRLVGPRDACDAIWQRWSSAASADRSYNQQLYVCRSARPSTAGTATPASLRLATLHELETIATNAAAMQLEDLGIDPLQDSRKKHFKNVREKIVDGSVYVLEQQGRIVFQMAVSIKHRLGCQLSGTYVPQAYRNQGLATSGVRQLCQLLLKDSPFVTLHVNAANKPAVRAYISAGFVLHADFRLINLGQRS